MRNLSVNIAVLLLIFLNCNLQGQDIIKMFKNEPVPYDSAAVMPIDTYRKVRLKVITADNLIDSLKIEKKSIAKQSQLQDSVNVIQTDIIFRQQATIERKDSVNMILRNNFDALYVEQNKPEKWYNRTWVQITIGVLGGYLLAR